MSVQWKSRVEDMLCRPRRHANKLLLPAMLAFVLPINEAVAFSGTYEIVNRNSGIVMEVAGFSTTNGGTVDQWVANGGLNQRWTLTSLGNANYLIANANSGLALEVAGSVTNNGAILDQSTNIGGLNQQWSITSLSNGCYEIVNANSQLPAEVAGSSTADGATVDQNAWTGSNNQQWLILPEEVTGTVSPPSGGSGVAASTFHGFNWADAGDNFQDGPILLSGMAGTNTYPAVESEAGVVLGAFETVGANAVRIPINPATVIGTWWKSYKAAIDTATSLGMKVIICPWCRTDSDDGVVDDSPSYWQMWDTVVTNYNGNGNVYFEVLNEPYGYSTSGWLNLVSSWLARYPTVAHGRVLAGGTGYDGDVPNVASSLVTSGCLFSVHDYGFWNSSDVTDSFFYNNLSGEVGAYASRCVMTEFGASMQSQYNYAGGDQSNNAVASMIGFCSFCASNQMGSVYWPGLRDGDSYSMFSRNANTTALALNSASGMALVEYGWGYYNGAGTYQIVNGNSGLALEVAGSSTTSGANVDQSSYLGGGNQQWTLSKLGNGYYAFTNVNSQMVLEVAASSLADGGNVDQANWSDGANQQWGILNLADGFYAITNRNSGLALEVAGSSTTNGANVDQSPYSGSPDQVWTFAGTNVGVPSVAPVTAPGFTPSDLVSSGTAVTMSEAANLAPPFYYQWQTDGGSGGGLTNIPGATNATYHLNTTNFPVEVAQFDVVVTNSSEVLTSAVAGLTIYYTAPAMLTDAGTSLSPGTYDISQLIGGGNPYYGDGLNYYDDNGINHGGFTGQTFTTGANSAEYNLTSVAIDAAGPNSSGTGVAQPYNLFIYSVANNTATLMAYYTATNFTFTFGDWLEWSGFTLPLKANTLYAYSFGEASSTGSYAALGVSPTNTDLYPGGQICTISSEGGPITYGASGNSDAVFDLGLKPIKQNLTLRIQNIGDGELQLQWSTGVLLQATNLAGPWTTNTSATSPYPVTPSAPQMYYQIKSP